ncbi:heat shock 70 kDa protein 12A-like [Mya arenaria]|uniref:heat shock 70 kDa protein 12A-like n=1 Tax=Mya arenaria TaxID=6604 RepID=UPI0022E6253A|nr:heat shock 70 kDa protein 12A-like [Mya arenaria]
MSRDAVVVAAIDFGTTYSGWAFSFKHEFKSDPIKVSAKTWTGGQLVSSKGPTCVLIKPDGRTLAAFGYEAESRYADLAEEEKHVNWFFFRRFKMMLYGKIGMQRDILLKDATGKELPAKTVFSLSIKFLRDDMLAMSQQRLAGDGLADNEVHWVLTVPAIWNDAAKQFMREAAEEAGIPSDQLTIALEPEAASLYCRHLPVEKNKGSKAASLAQFKTGTKYMVLDCGGGTVDITVHEVANGGHLKELHKASGGAWGGTKVDDAFFTFLQKLVGAPVLKTFMTQHMDDYIDIFRDFEIKKRDVAPSRDNKVTFRIPIALLDVFYDMTDETLKQVIPQTRYAGMITLTGDKMRIDASVVKSFFKESVDSIVEHLGNLFREPSVAGCAAIVMVGGFSESPMLQETIKIQFPDVRVIIPDEAGLAILKGAVIFGHCPNIISERISKYTYGVACSQTYMQGIHPPDRKTLNEDGEEEVDDIFSVHVRAGQKLDIDEVQTARTYSVGQADQQAMTIQFFATDKTDPMFVDDPGCNRIGIMQVPVPGFGCDRQAKISLKFGKTEIEASVKIVHTSDVSKANINFLG